MGGEIEGRTENAEGNGFIGEIIMKNGDPQFWKHMAKMELLMAMEEQELIKCIEAFAKGFNQHIVLLTC